MAAQVESEKVRQSSVGGAALPTPPESDTASAKSEYDDSLDSLSTASSQSSVEYPLPPPNPAVQVLDLDKKTPDAHVERDARLIRLTGVHPFNTEAPLSDLFNEGFLTSPELFYVRNHGAVPEVKDSEIPDWELSIEGLVDRPFKITLKEMIEQFEQRTYPITLVCAGNRRKEQNVVRKTKGFSWGAAGVSTALFTGCHMADVIAAAKPQRKAKFVCMEGADKLPNGYYGTSVKLNWAMDPNRGIMLAHKMNGQMLKPDHGKPLRAVVPGQIGGRSVKWLTKLIVTGEPSDNWYHIWDNRVLPTMVSPEESVNKPGWWLDERYAIYDLNNNSATVYPAHEERLNPATAPETYRAKGYAYAGGGKRITRVEITLDKGRSWRLANVDYAEDRYRAIDDDRQLFGGRLDVSWRETSFCWCFWDLDIPVSDLVGAQDIMVRTMDESMAIQPRDMYWSVLGMMNNPWFRVVIHKEGNEVRFEHPTQPALMPGGWMERVKKEGGNLTNGFWGEKMAGEAEKAVEVAPAKEIRLTKDGVDRRITIEEFREHQKEDNPWFVLNGEVFDGLPFLEGHPGGAQSIVSAAGQDATEEFMAIHSETAKGMMPDYHIGTLDDEAKKILAAGETVEADSGPRDSFLDPKIWRKGFLHSKTTVSWDTKIFTFKLDHEEQKLGLPTGQHLMMRLRDPVSRDNIIRSYTPISEQSRRGFVDILVKIYYDTKEKKGGRMTQALDQIPVGHFIDFKGPIGKFEYLGKGMCTVNGKARKVNRFYMICGGSGITPIYQVYRAVMQDKEDHTHCSVLNGNRLIEDILCRTELDGLALDNDHKSKLIHTLTQAPDDWTGLRGRIAAPLLGEHVLCEDKGSSMVLICGPEPLEKSVKTILTGELGWAEEDLLFF